MGFDAAMMADTTEGMKRFAGLARLRGQCPAAPAGPHDATCGCALTAAPPLGRSARTVLVGNVGQLEGGLELLPDAAADDGMLDVVIVAPRTLRDWLRVVLRIVRWPHTQDRHLERFRGQAISIDADRPAPRQMDGEVIAEGHHMDVRVGPGALVVRVPQSTAAAAA